MTGICESCGKSVEKLFTCPLCGAIVCSDCIQEVGCKVCGGKIQGKNNNKGKGHFV